MRHHVPQQHATLLQDLKAADFEAVYTADDHQTSWSIFYGVAIECLDHMCPNRIVTLTSSDPLYTTLVIKLLHAKGRLEEACACAWRRLLQMCWPCH